MQKQKQRMLIIELNEFNPEFLEETSKKLRLQNIQKSLI